MHEKKIRKVRES